MAKRIVIAGGTGFIGRALARRLRERGDEVVVLTRGRPGARDGVEHVTWDAATLGHWVGAIDGADAIVHLTGKSVDARPTRRTITELVRSRVQPTRLVGEAHRCVASPPPVWVQASTLAIYRTAGLASPAWLTRLGAPVLDSDPMLALTGRRAIPQRLLDEGLDFRDLDFRTALQQAMTRTAR